MDLIEQLRKEYTLKQIEEFCGMPRRTLQPSIKVPKKYFPKLKEMTLGLSLVDSRPPIAVIEPKPIIKEVPVPCEPIDIIPTHFVVGNAFYFNVGGKPVGRYVPKNGEKYYLIPEKE